MAKVKDGKAIQICASSFIPHLASDILKNECLLPLLSSRGNNIKFEGFELQVGYTFFGLLPLPHPSSLVPQSTEAKNPLVSTLRRINREEERQLQQRERYPSQEGDKRGNLHAREHFRPSIRIFGSRLAARPWSTLHLLLLLFLLFPSRIRDGRITSAAAALAKCSEMRGIWVDSGEGGRL